MARLTIRQASQQGFASTLTIHRHIKDGSLPVYEDGDTKLLEVDDLIAVFGEPGNKGQTEAAPAAANGQVDIREYNRLKAKLEQKNKKNMWLAADLAEVVRELKEKEAKFEKERNRLLTVLEQAQGLLLREVEKSGGGKRPARPGASMAAAAATPDAARATGTAGAPMAPEPPPSDEATPPAATEQEPLVLDTMADASGDNANKEQAKGEEGVTAGLPPLPPEGEVPAEHMVLPEEKESINPLMPPLEDPGAPRSSRRILGTTTWLLLFALAGGGFVFYEFRTKVLVSVNKVLQALS